MNINKMIKFISLVIIFFLVNQANAQLELCSGNSGDPIFIETFGTGILNTPLPDGTTTFNFVDGSPFDGEYTVSSNSAYFDWHSIEDHTPNDNNGKMLIVNADFEPGEFYRTTVTGLCEQTTYEFSAWLINLLPPSGCGGNGISINIQYEIWDSTDTVQLAIGATGSIENTSSPIWRQFALLFQTEIGQSSVILKIKNHGVGGCGNDLALDDIEFKTCGDNVVIEDTETNNSITICGYQTPFSTQIKAVSNASNTSTRFYQWQESIDGINWINIIGENSDTYNTPPLDITTFYRVIAAEDASNIDNVFCNSYSDIFEIVVIPNPPEPLSDGDLTLCEGDPTPISVTVPSGVTVNWYNRPTGGVILQKNSSNFSPNNVSGTYYAEASLELFNCISTTRTAVSITYTKTPRAVNETLSFCENTDIKLYANSTIPNVTYMWSTGETSEHINVDEPGNYVVEINNNGCKATKTITLVQINNPIIEDVYSDGNNIIVNTSNHGDFEYSLDGSIFRLSNIFENIEGGLYTIYVKERSCNELVKLQFIHFYIPKYFTPNDDGFNDMFELKGLEFFDSSEVRIFNRYGKLLKATKNSSFSWDGMFAGQQLPSDDYWYVIITNDQRFTGHFSLKR